jgi:hypoxanthine-DNA glycosylase
MPSPISQLKSFGPFVDRRAAVLILGTMPGPEALRRREYYGFPGNHFWKIIADLYNGGKPFASYAEKLRLLRKNRIALWDTIGSCRREGASDSAICDAVPNDIPALIKKYPNIRKIFLNGKTAEKFFLNCHAGKIKIPHHTMPSTSPAHAAMPYAEKLKRWSALHRLTA